MAINKRGSQDSAQDAPRDLTPCCGFARLARQGDAYAEGLRVWFTDDGKMVCQRCLYEALKVAEDQLEERARRYGFRRRRG